MGGFYYMLLQHAADMVRGIVGLALAMILFGGLLWLTRR